MKKLFQKKFDEAQVLYVIAGGLLVVGILALIWFGYQRVSANRASQALVTVPAQEGQETVSGEDECEKFRFDGKCLGKEDKQPQMVAVMVENHIESRDLSGVQDAAIVYEAPVEGNITRFMALYEAGIKVNKVGPIRSARPYYLDWLAEYGDALYMHVGGSPAALEKITETKVFDLNEFYKGWFYWRAEDRYAPHNVYTSSEMWKSALEQEKREVNDFEAWKFSSSLEACQEDCINRIEVSYSSPYYKPVWSYDIKSKRYTRSERGSGIGYLTDNLVLVYTRSVVLDEVGRLGLFTTGEGLVQIFSGGKIYEGKWKKEEANSKMRFVDAQGNEIPLRPGKIWISIVTQNHSVDYITKNEA